MHKTILIISVIILASLFSISNYYLFSPMICNDVVVDIQYGQSARTIAQNLFKAGVIKSPTAFYILVRTTSNDKKLKQGAYLFDGTMNMITAMKKIITGEILVQRVTIPEGLSIYKTIRILAEHKIGNYDSLLTLSKDPEFIQKITGFKIDTLEGFLYPDTYTFSYKNDERFVLETMVKNLFMRLNENNINYTDKENFYRILKLASIVEKEAVFSDEKPLIASVYSNRLKTNMLLQADPTSTYHLEKEGIHKKKLYYKDVRRDTPHNTYTNPGLPPTPICSPSISSIQASINPLQTNYLFFFATPERRHIFTTSYAEHLKRQRQQKSS